MDSFVAIDFETANEQRRSACAVGLVRFNANGQVEDRFYSLLRPHPDVDYFNPVNTWIHGLTAADVADSPQWSEIAAEVEQFLADSPIVAHNMAFDGYVLSDLASIYQSNPISNRRFCTARLARKILAAELERKRLDDVFGYYFPGEEFAHHEATADAEACGRIFARMLQDHGVEEIEHLCPVVGARRSRAGGSTGGRPTAAELVQKTAEELIQMYCTGDPVLQGHRVVFTGKLRHGQRAAIQELVRAAGGIADAGITKKTTMLVVGIPDPRRWAEGSSASKKLLKATELRAAGSPIEVVTEEEFFNRFKDVQN